MKQPPAVPGAPAPYFRFFINDWTRALHGLKAQERGVFLGLVMRMHETGAPLNMANDRLALYCGCDSRALSRIVEMLLVDEKLVRTSSGLWSQLIETEINHRKNVSGGRSKNASEGWKKRQQNQPAQDANAYHSPDIQSYRDTEAEGPEGLSAADDDSDGYYDRDAGPSVASPSSLEPSYQSGDFLEDPDNVRFYVEHVSRAYLSLRAINGSHVRLPRDDEGSVQWSDIEPESSEDRDYDDADRG